MNPLSYADYLHHDPAPVVRPDQATWSLPAEQPDIWRTVWSQLLVSMAGLDRRMAKIEFTPKVLTFTAENEIDEVLAHTAGTDAEGRLTFDILIEGEAQTFPYRAKAG